MVNCQGICHRGWPEAVNHNGLVCIFLDIEGTSVVAHQVESPANVWHLAIKMWSEAGKTVWRAAKAIYLSHLLLKSLHNGRFAGAIQTLKYDDGVSLAGHHRALPVVFHHLLDYGDHLLSLTPTFVVQDLHGGFHGAVERHDKDE